MNSKKSKIGDNDNSFFELPNTSLEVKPGLDLNEQKVTVELKGHSRFTNTKKSKEIPKLSLTERIQKAKKGE